MKIAFLGTVANPLRRAVAPEMNDDTPASVERRAYPARVSAFPRARLERALQVVGMLDCGLTAAEDGCDAMLIDSLGDYGLQELREAVAVPVIGAGETGMAAAARGGRRFAIVTVWPESMNFIPIELMRAYGHADACTAIRNVGTDEDVKAIAGPDGYLERIHDAEQSIFDKVVEAARQCVDDGADAVMLGCTCMSPMAAKVADALPFPVINPLREGYLEAMRQAAEKPRPSEAILTTRVEQIRKMVDAVAGEPSEECPVCIVAAD